MGLLGNIVNFIKSGKDIGISDGSQTLKSIYSTPYITPIQNWYKATPYGFSFTSRDGVVLTCYLPIVPENITVSTHFGTNIIPTLYGTIEEHSEQRYYDIIISGTTGMAPQYVSPFSGDTPNSTIAVANGNAGKNNNNDKKPGRTTAGDSVLSSLNASGFFSKTAGAVSQLANTVTSFASNFASVADPTAVDPSMSGYVAFHNFYKFLLNYKKDVAGITSSRSITSHPLTYLNYKDNQKYDCAITKFDLKRSADRPMLYQYSLAMRAYNLRDMSEDVNFGKFGDLEQRRKDLGLDGIKGSWFKAMKQSSNAAKGVMGIVGGKNNLLGG